jgi:hypothetical protein
MFVSVGEKFDKQNARPKKQSLNNVKHLINNIL